MTYFKYTFLLFFLANIFACKNEPPKTEVLKTEKEQPAQVIEQTDVLLICQSSKASANEADVPEHEVFLQLAESKLKVADILNCETLAPESYANYQIPKEAISAVGGWWAGAGDYLYVIEENGKYLVRKGGANEQSEAVDFDYKTIASFPKN